MGDRGRNVGLSLAAAGVAVIVSSTSSRGRVGHAERLPRDPEIGSDRDPHAARIRKAVRAGERIRTADLPLTRRLLCH